MWVVFGPKLSVIHTIWPSKLGQYDQPPKSGWNGIGQNDPRSKPEMDQNNLSPNCSLCILLTLSVWQTCEEVKRVRERNIFNNADLNPHKVWCNTFQDHNRNFLNTVEVTTLLLMIARSQTSEDLLTFRDIAVTKICYNGMGTYICDTLDSTEQTFLQSFVIVLACCTPTVLFKHFGDILVVDNIFSTSVPHV